MRTGHGLSRGSIQNLMSIVLMRHIKQFGMVDSAPEIQGPNTAEEQKVSKKEKVLARTSCGKSE